MLFWIMSKVIKLVIVKYGFSLSTCGFVPISPKSIFSAHNVEAAATRAFATTSFHLLVWKGWAGEAGTCQGNHSFWSREGIEHRRARKLASSSVFIKSDQRWQWSPSLYCFHSVCFLYSRNSKVQHLETTIGDTENRDFLPVSDFNYSDHSYSLSDYPLSWIYSTPWCLLCSD